MPGLLPIDRVDLWTVSLPVSAEHYERLSRSLSGDEMARADRFKFERDRRRFVVGRGALRSILGSYLGRDPDAIRFAYGSHGKPTLADVSAAGGVEFNASGSDELAVCAVTVGTRLGVDIELCRPIAEEDFPDQCLTAAERNALRALEPADRPAAFYRLWTLKEAFLKATGEGLSRPMSSVEFDLSPGRAVRLIGGEQNLPDWEGCTILEFVPGPQHVGALVLAGKGRTVTHRNWSP